MLLRRHDDNIYYHCLACRYDGTTTYIFFVLHAALPHGYDGTTTYFSIVLHAAFPNWVRRHDIIYCLACRITSWVRRHDNLLFLLSCMPHCPMGTTARQLILSLSCMLHCPMGTTARQIIMVLHAALPLGYDGTTSYIPIVLHAATTARQFICLLSCMPHCPLSTTARQIITVLHAALSPGYDGTTTCITIIVLHIRLPERLCQSINYYLLSLPVYELFVWDSIYYHHGPCSGTRWFTATTLAVGCVTASTPGFAVLLSDVCFQQFSHASIPSAPI